MVIKHILQNVSMDFAHDILIYLNIFEYPQEARGLEYYQSFMKPRLPSIFENTLNIETLVYTAPVVRIGQETADKSRRGSPGLDWAVLAWAGLA